MAKWGHEDLTAPTAWMEKGGRRGIKETPAATVILGLTVPPELLVLLEETGSMALLA